MVDWPPILAGLIGIVPAFAILALAYHRYDGKFKDETLFLLFMGGLFIGVPVALLESFLEGFAIVAILGFPIFEQLLKTVILNLPRFHGDPFVRFYGGGLGLGLGAMLTLILAMRAFQSSGLYNDLGELVTAPTQALVELAIGMTVLLLHFGTGILIGDGVANGRPFRTAAVAVAIAFPFRLLFLDFVPFLPYLAVMVTHAAAVAYLVVRNILPNALPAHERRKVKRLFAGTLYRAR